MAPSGIYFDSCTFSGGLAVPGGYHAMVGLGGCSFGDGSIVTCKEVASGAAKETTMEDNFVKVYVCCMNVSDRCFA